MATPHISGCVALMLKTPVGKNDKNGNGIWDPLEIKLKLEANATDLGPNGWDPAFGSGLVNALPPTA